jgi:ferric-dicitrate binding protein FerR (iron transport regulator)
MTRHGEPMLPGELQAVLDAMPATDAGVGNAQRDAAWQRLRARLHDPARVPYTDDVKAPIELVRDEAPVHTGDSPAPQVAISAPERRSALWVAAAAAVVLAAGASTYAAGTRSYSVPRGSAPQQVALADGSTAWVSPGSRIQVSRRLGWPALLAPASRTVALDGEAYFDVRRDGRPFAVEASQVQVQVLGTRFAVRGASASASARVEVTEGRVAVTAGGQRVLLGAGEGVSWRAGSLQQRSFDAARVATWRTGGLAALDEPLGDVLAELARRFDVEITVDRDVNAGAIVSLFYPSMPAVDVVLGDLCTAQALVFERTSRGFHIGRP